MANKGVYLTAEMLDCVKDLTDAEASDIIRALAARLAGQDYDFRTRSAKLLFTAFDVMINDQKSRSAEISRKRADAVNARWAKAKAVKAIEEQHKEEETPPAPLPDLPVIEPEPEPVEDKENVVENPPPIAKPVSAHRADYDWIEDEFRQIFQDWLDYKRREKKGTYKTEKTLRMCYNNLIKISNHNPAIARETVDIAISNGWMGLFPTDNGRRTNNRRRDRIDYDELGRDLAQRCADDLERTAAGQRSGEGEFMPPSL